MSIKTEMDSGIMMINMLEIMGCHVCRVVEEHSIELKDGNLF